jgi:hypothetical protein
MAKEHFCPTIGCRERVPDWSTFCPKHTQGLHPQILGELQGMRLLSHSQAWKERPHYCQLVSWIVGNHHLATLPPRREPGEEV